MLCWHSCSSECCLNRSVMMLSRCGCVRLRMEICKGWYTALLHMRYSYCFSYTLRFAITLLGSCTLPMNWLIHLLHYSFSEGSRNLWFPEETAMYIIREVALDMCRLHCHPIAFLYTHSCFFRSGISERRITCLRLTWWLRLHMHFMYIHLSDIRGTLNLT